MGFFFFAAYKHISYGYSRGVERQIRDSDGVFGADLITHYIAMDKQVAKCENRALTIMFIYFAI